MKPLLVRHLLRPTSLLALAILGTMIFMAVAAPWLSPPDPDSPEPEYKYFTGSLGLKPIPPNAVLPLGAVPSGFKQYMDIYHSLVWGSRSALKFGLVVVLVSAVFGSLVGALSAYLGGWPNHLVMRFTDAFLAFPIIAGVIFIEQVYFTVSNPNTLPSNWFNDPVPLTAFQEWMTGVDPLLIALIFFTWMTYARLINAQVMRIREVEYVEAARSLGASAFWLIRRHLIPNSMAPAIVLAARDVGAIVIFQTTLAFIGLSNSSPWGVTLAAGRRWIIGPGGNLLHTWWVFFPITIVIILFGIGWNLLGDSLNTWYYPHRER